MEIEQLAEKTLSNGRKIFLEKQSLPREVAKELGYAVELRLRIEAKKNHDKPAKDSPGKVSRYFVESDYLVMLSSIQDDDQFVNLCNALSKIISKDDAQKARENGLQNLVNIRPYYNPQRKWNRCGY